MYNPKGIAASGYATTQIPSELMYRSKNVHYQSAGSQEPIPERMVSSMESKRKGEIIQKI